MKFSFPFLLLVTACACAGFGMLDAGRVGALRNKWRPTNQTFSIIWSNSPDWTTDAVYRAYYRTDFRQPISAWQFLGATTNTYLSNVTVTLTPRWWYFTCTMSNSAGVSDLSNIVSYYPTNQTAGGGTGTLGQTGTGDGIDGTDGYVLASPYTFSGTTGAHITGWTWIGAYTIGGTKTVYVGIYSDGGAAPDKLLESFSHTEAMTSSVTTFTEAVSGSLTLTNGTRYWVAVASNAGSGWENAKQSGGSVAFRALTSLPTTWGTSAGTAAWNVCLDLIYANP